MSEIDCETLGEKRLNSAARAYAIHFLELRLLPVDGMDETHLKSFVKNKSAFGIGANGRNCYPGRHLLPFLIKRRFVR